MRCWSVSDKTDSSIDTDAVIKLPQLPVLPWEFWIFFSENLREGEMSLCCCH